MSKYKSVLTGYINNSKNGEGRYLSIKNETDEPITIEPGGKIFLNETPQSLRDKYPTMPHFRKSVKVEEENEKLDDINF
jgi:hypothetical protein